MPMASSSMLAQEEQLQLAVDAIRHDDPLAAVSGRRAGMARPHLAADVHVEHDRAGGVRIRAGPRTSAQIVPAQLVLVFLGVAIGVGLFANLLLPLLQVDQSVRLSCAAPRVKRWDIRGYSRLLL